MRLTDGLAAALGAAGLVAVVAGLVRWRSWRPGVGVAIDLWLAAGLLRLVGDASWERITAAAAIVALRGLVDVVLRRGDVARARPA